MNNQQESFNSPSLPGMGERETENQRIAPRLRPKTKLRGLPQQQEGSTADKSSPVNNADEPQSFTQTPEPWTMPDARSLSLQQPEIDTETFPQLQQMSWHEMATRAFQDAQQPLSETTTQEFSSPAKQPHPDTNASATSSAQQLPAGVQADRNTSRLNKPKFSKSAFSKRNSRQIREEGTVANPQADPRTDTQVEPNPPARANGTPSGMYPNPNVTRDLSNTGSLPGSTGALDKTGALMHPAGEYSDDTGMLKLNQAVKVVRIPVAGKPGEYKTGILPIQAQSNTSTLPPPNTPENLTMQEKIKKHSKLVALTTLIVLILFSSGIYLLIRTTGNTTASVSANKNSAGQTSLNTRATANVQATATFEDSELINDPLSSNARYWKTTQPTDLKKGLRFTFIDNAYHISSIKTGGVVYFASSILVNEIPPATYTYSVDMQQIKGDDTTDYNFFGLLFNYTQIRGQAVSYAFRIIGNKHKPRYEFCTLDGNRKPIWSDPIWKHDTGKEFLGTKEKNNLKVHVDNHNFTFWVNGTQVGKVHDSSYGAGAIGLGVNGLSGGSEVAFTNLLLTSI